MKKNLAWFILSAFVLGLSLGCEETPDPTKQPGFVDTSDPTKLKMPPLPNQGGGGAGAAGAGASAPPAGGAGS